MINRIILFVFIFLIRIDCFAQQSILWKDFENPPLKYRPVPFWHLNGKLSAEEIKRQVADAAKSGFGGIAVLPVTAGPQHPTGLPTPGMSPKYLSEDYFARYNDILKAAMSNKIKIILYDDIDFPSGSAGGELQLKYPEFTRKVLEKTDTVVAGQGQISIELPKGVLMAVVALNSNSHKRINLSSFVKDGNLKWQVPGSNWKISIFTCKLNADAIVDFMDPAAVRMFTSLTYDRYAKRFGTYFGNVIQQTFFDDVGYVGMERGWTLAFNKKFKQRFGRDPDLYYPALWEDIGPETAAARVAFFDTRAELLSEGFPKIIADWDNHHGLKSSGHPPGNYEIQPVDMSFDIFKFYRHEHIPTMDAIFFYGHGRDGYKLVSSAAAVYDKPVVASETFGAFLENGFDVKTMYRTAMEIFARGINFLVPHGMWYDPNPKSVRIPPLISAYSEKIGPSLGDFNDFAARTSMLLTGGKQVSEIGIIYPITSLQGFYHFQAKDYNGYGKYVPSGTDYLALGNLLTNDIHRDFTFIHPQLFLNAQYQITANQIVLKNKVNKQRYQVIILPAGEVVSYEILKKIKKYYDAGGKVIATTLLPTKSAEFGMDDLVIKAIKEIFAVDPKYQLSDSSATHNTNPKGGAALFIPKPNAVNLANALNRVDAHPDILIESNTHPKGGNGALSYIHKINDNTNIFYFTNSTDDSVNTYVDLRGKIKPELWDPNTGKKSVPVNAALIKIKGVSYTRVKLCLPPVTSIFIVSDI